MIFTVINPEESGKIKKKSTLFHIILPHEVKYMSVHSDLLESLNDRFCGVKYIQLILNDIGDINTDCIVDALQFCLEQKYISIHSDFDIVTYIISKKLGIELKLTLKQFTDLESFNIFLSLVSKYSNYKNDILNEYYNFEDSELLVDIIKKYGYIIPDTILKTKKYNIEYYSTRNKKYVEYDLELLSKFKYVYYCDAPVNIQRNVGAMSPIGATGPTGPTGACGSFYCEPKEIWNGSYFSFKKNENNEYMVHGPIKFKFPMPIELDKDIVYEKCYPYSDSVTFDTRYNSCYHYCNVFQNIMNNQKNSEITKNWLPIHLKKDDCTKIFYLPFEIYKKIDEDYYDTFIDAKNLGFNDTNFEIHLLSYESIEGFIEFVKDFVNMVESNKSPIELPFNEFEKISLDKFCISYRFNKHQIYNVSAQTDNQHKKHIDYLLDYVDVDSLIFEYLFKAYFKYHFVPGFNLSSNSTNYSIGVKIHQIVHDYPDIPSSCYDVNTY